MIRRLTSAIAAFALLSLASCAEPIGAPDGTGSIGAVGDTELVDRDGDGVDDAVRIWIGAEVEAAGVYEIVVTVVDEHGSQAAAHGSAVLSVGNGEIPVDLPADSVFAATLSGVWSLVDAVLFRLEPTEPGASALDIEAVGSGIPFKVAESADVGAVTDHIASSLVPTEIIPSRFVGTAADNDGDGVVDTLEFAGSIAVPHAGSYTLTAFLEAPDGSHEEVADVVSLDLGINPYRLELTIDPEEHGAGEYNLYAVYVVSDQDSSEGASGHSAYVYVD